MKKSGFTLVEVLVAASIITASILGIVGVYSTFLARTFINTPSIQAAYLADEGVEAIKTMRDASWTTYIASLTVGNTYRLSFSTSTALWKATTSPALLDNQFDRTVVLANAYRDSGDNLATSGTVDNNTRLVTVTVSWAAKSGTSSKTVMTYINNLFSN